MKFIAFTTALIMSCTTLTATALEMTATTKDVNRLNPEISVAAQNAAVIAAISKVNKDVLAILRCNNKNMFYKPKDSTADSDGCVGASISTTTKTQTVTLPNVLFDSYPGMKNTGKGYSGTSTRIIDLSGMVADGATAISVKGARTSFASSKCNGAVTMNVANVNSSIGTQTYNCHYDNSPNRSHNFKWSYNASTKHLTVYSQSSQIKKKATAEAAKLTGITASYTVTKTVLKIGDGK